MPMSSTTDEAAIRSAALDAHWATVRRRTRQLERLRRAATFLIVLALALAFVFPLVWMAITSLKSIPEVYSYPVVWWPAVLRFSNYPKALTLFPFLRYAWNTAQITIPATIGV